MRHCVAYLAIALTFGGSAAFGQRVKLLNQPLTIDTPAGFVDRSWEHVSQGFPLHFNLPAHADGSRSLYPEISIASSPEMNGTDVPMALSEYAKTQTVEGRTIIRPRFVQIAGQQAIEFAFSGDLILDYRGGSIVRPVVLHEIAIAYQSRLYHCRLGVELGRHISYIKVLHEFCGSARFGEVP